MLSESECPHLPLASDIISALLAYPLNALLIFMIVARTPEPLRDYGRTLLWNSLADVYFVTLNILLLPVKDTEFGPTASGRYRCEHSFDF